VIDILYYILKMGIACCMGMDGRKSDVKSWDLDKKYESLLKNFEE
jgi:hypothetical protein